MGTENHAYEALFQLVVPGDPSSSSLYKILASGRMPLVGPRLNSDALAAIAGWIGAGALDN